MAKALSDSGKPGVIMTFDVLPHDSEQYWNCIVDSTKGMVSRRQLLGQWKELLRTILFLCKDSPECLCLRLKRSELISRF